MNVSTTVDVNCGGCHVLDGAPDGEQWEIYTVSAVSATFAVSAVSATFAVSAVSATFAATADGAAVCCSNDVTDAPAPNGIRCC